MVTVQKLINEEGLRVDGRRLDELRPIKMEVGLLANADGSAYIEHGKNKIIVAVYGPKEAQPKHVSLHDRAVVRCRYHMAPFSTDERKSPAPSRREIEISKVVREALEPVIFTEYFPRSMIDIFIEVLQSDGGSRCAAVTASSLALADAGIPLKDLVVGCALGEADMPIAFIPVLGKISLLQMDGMFTEEEFIRALNMAKEACMKIYALQKQTLKEKYLQVEKEVRESLTLKE